MSGSAIADRTGGTMLAADEAMTRLQDLVARARAAGADQAEAVLSTSQSLGVDVRMGRTDQVSRSESCDLALRVLVGHQAATVSASDTSPVRFAELVERAVAMARVVPEDPFLGLAEQTYAGGGPDLDRVDLTEQDVAALTARALAAEDAGRAVPGTTNSEGAGAGAYRSRSVLVTSAGFARASEGTGFSVSASIVGGNGTGMQRDYDYHSVTHLADLDDPALIGRRAGEQAVARLNPTRPRTATVPVVYAPRVAGSLLGHLSSAINGAGVARGTSFLKDSLHAKIFADGITLRDDPHRPRAGRSGLFDGEGVATAPRNFVEDGILRSWIMDQRAARQLNFAPTGHGSTFGRGSSATNFYMFAGTRTPAELMADIGYGLYVTELIGSGINGLTGDYSRGAAGFLIRDGALAEPVAEITIAGNLKDIFLRLVPASDLVFRRGTDAPTIRVDGLTMAGA